MAIFDDSVPPNAEAVKLGAQRLRELKTDLNTLLGTLFEDDGTPKANTVTTAEIVDLAVTAAKLAADSVTTLKIIDGALSADATGRAKMADGYITLAKILDAIFTADASGRAKFADEFINAAKLATDAVTTVKILDGAVTPEKLSAETRVASAFVRWTGAGYAKKNVTQTIPSSTTITVTSHGVALGNDENDVVAGHITSNVLADGTPDPGAGIGMGTMFYIFPVDSSTISLHTTAADALTGANPVELDGNFSNGSGWNYYLKYLTQASVFRRGCDIVPLVSASNQDRIHGYKVIWRSAWDSAVEGVVNLSQSWVTNNTNRRLHTLLPTASLVEVVYFENDDDIITGSDNFTTAEVNAFTGPNFLTAFE